MTCFFSSSKFERNVDQNFLASFLISNFLEIDFMIKTKDKNPRSFLSASEKCTSN